MGKVSDELVERVAKASAIAVLGAFDWSALTDATKDSWRNQARAAIAALSTPAFVLPLAEEMLRAVDLCDPREDLLANYRAAKG